MKISPVEPKCSMWTDGQTNRQRKRERHDEANNHFLQFRECA